MVDDLERIKTLVSKNKVGFGILLGTIMGIGGPFVINYAYSASDKYFFTLWNAQDMLSYYGTLLGAVATIIAVTWTINFNRESAEKDRRLSEKNNFRNYGIQICIDYLELCNHKRISDLINDISKSDLKNNVSKYNLYVKSKISEIDMRQIEIQEKFDIFHSNIDIGTKVDIAKFYAYSGDFLNKLEDLLLITEEIPIPKLLYSDVGDVIMEEHSDKYNSFKKTMQGIIFTYDYSINNRENN